MMRFYLASPGSRMHAECAVGMPVLLSYALWNRWWEDYMPAFDGVLIDSGAYSEMNSGKVVDLGAYAEWSRRWEGRVDAIAGLDDIGGDWRRSLKNYERVGFPTMHDTDPPELLADLVPIARERGGWIGIGLQPPRGNKGRWLRETLDEIPDDLHVHGWAMRAYRHMRRFDSMDSTNWWRDGLRIQRDFPWLTGGEALEIVVKRYQREEIRDDHEALQSSLFAVGGAG